MNNLRRFWIVTDFTSGEILYARSIPPKSRSTRETLHEVVSIEDYKDLQAKNSQLESKLRKARAALAEEKK